jgi:hypothetical protein
VIAVDALAVKGVVMDKLQLKQVPEASTGMLIRKPSRRWSNKRILIEWPGYSGPTTVEWRFAPQRDGTTFVTVTEAGFTGDGDDLLKYVADSTQGFTLVLAGLKALLEHGVRLNLTADRFPKGIEGR